MEAVRASFGRKPQAASLEPFRRSRPCRGVYVPREPSSSAASAATTFPAAAAAVAPRSAFVRTWPTRADAGAARAEP